jgi:hypothetical protein
VTHLAAAAPRHVTILKSSDDFIEQAEDLRRGADEFVGGRGAADVF